MFFLPFIGRDPPLIKGQRVTLRFPLSSDFAEWSQLRRGSRGFLEPWEPKWTADELDRSAWRERMRRYREEFARGSGAPFLIFMNDGGRLAGGISIGNIRYGVSQTGQVGYWMGEQFSGRGFMQDALHLVSGFAFDALKLHRIEAACIPDNARSIRVLEKAGFRREGLLRSYLKINGSWQDHYLYALIDAEYQDRKRRGAAIVD